MSWREKMPPAFVRMFSIFHQDVFRDRPSLEDLANSAIGHVKADEREGVSDFINELLASGVTRGELRTLMKKAGVRDVALTNPLPLFELIRDKLSVPEAETKKRQRAALIAAVREVLLRDWDPIGIVELQGPEDEYDSYIGGVVRLIEERASAERIARYLREIAETQLGIAGDEARTWSAAKKLAALGGEN